MKYKYYSPELYLYSPELYLHLVSLPLSLVSIELFIRVVSAIISDDGFSLQQPHVSSAPKIAKELLKWLSHPDHNAAGIQFAQNLTTSLEVCFGSKGQSMKIKREEMWGLYHKLCTSVDFAASWTSFLQQNINTEACPIFFHYI